jgi:hypothetical protein
MSVCIHTYIHKYIHTYIHTYTQQEDNVGVEDELTRRLMLYDDEYDGQQLDWGAIPATPLDQLRVCMCIYTYTRMHVSLCMCVCVCVCVCV